MKIIIIESCIEPEICPHAIFDAWEREYYCGKFNHKLPKKGISKKCKLPDYIAIDLNQGIE